MSIVTKLLSFISILGTDIKEIYSRLDSSDITKSKIVSLYTLTVTVVTSVIQIAYTPGYVKVYKNGLLLYPVIDYEATSGINITFTTPLEVGDEIIIDRLTLNGLPTLNKLLIYYGYPVAYKGIWNATSVAQELSNNFDYWVVGDTYQDPAHEEYANTVSIINTVRANGVKVYGYVPIGLNTSGLTIGQIQTKIDQWDSIGVDGIFLDEFGFDYGNTRQRQIDCVIYVHSKSLPYCANAWTVHDFACDDVSELPWGSGDWRYVNFTTYNPTNQVLPRNTNDCYMFENFCWSNTGPTNIWDTQDRANTVRSLSISKNFETWALAVFPETAPGVLDTSLLGNLKNMDFVGNYISANAFLYDFKTVGSGGFSFGSNGTPLWAPLTEMPESASAAQTGPVADYGNFKETRYFGKVKLEVINSATIQRVLLTDSTTVTISDIVNPTLIGEESDPVFTYDVNQTLTRIDYASGNYKLYNYSSGVLSSIVYYVGNSVITKTYNYNGNGTLNNIVTTKT